MKQKITWWAAEASALLVPDAELESWHVPVRQGDYEYNAKDMLKWGYVFIAEQEVEFFMPKLQDRIAEITEAMEGEIQRIRAEAESNAKEIRGKLQNLLALSYEGTQNAHEAD